MRTLDLLGVDSKALVDDEVYEWAKSYKWELDGRGRYVFTRIRKNGVRETHYLHRLILGVTGETVYVDHADRNPLNNLRSNLRTCTNSQNQANRSTFKSNRKFKGVYYRPTKKAWVAEITCNGVRHYLGFFKCEIRAAMAYNAKALALFGEFALLNKISAADAA
jgi:hypothetical protein